MKSSILVGVVAASLLASGLARASEFDAGGWHVEKHGSSGPPIIFLPGLASGAWVWADSARRLQKGHVVYLLTPAGADGRAPVAGTTLESLRHDLVTLIESRHIAKPVLVGHSLGAALSLALATEHSALISGVIAVDGLPVFPGSERANDRNALADQVRAQIGQQTPEQFKASQQAYMLRVGAIDPKTAGHLAELTSRSDIQATAAFAAEGMALDLRPKLAGISVLVVEISPFNAPDFESIHIDEARKTFYYHSLLEGVPHLEMISISPARHFVMFDQPEKFALMLDAALRKVYEAKTPPK